MVTFLNLKSHPVSLINAQKQTFAAAFFIFFYVNYCNILKFRDKYVIFMTNSILIKFFIGLL